MTIAANHRLIIVMPVFEDRDSAGTLMRKLVAACPVRPYIIAVEDGSVRNVLQSSAISDAGLSGEVIHLARNMGHQRAIAIGISYVAANLNADVVVIMDSDGEDRPESITALIEELQSKNLDVVVAERRKRSETLSFRTFYIVYRFVFQVLTGRVIRFGNFTALSMPAVKRLSSMQEVWVHLASSLMISRLRIGRVQTDRGRRYAGRSQMNFVSLTLHGLRSVMVFAEDVLVRVGLACAILSAVALVLLGVAVLLKAVGFATPGWFSITIGLLVLILMQAGALMFSTLMISGVIRSVPPVTRTELTLLIDHVDKVTDDMTAPQTAVPA